MSSKTTKNDDTSELIKALFRAMEKAEQADTEASIAFLKYRKRQVTADEACQVVSDHRILIDECVEALEQVALELPATYTAYLLMRYFDLQNYKKELNETSEMLMREIVKNGEKLEMAEEGERAIDNE